MSRHGMKLRWKLAPGEEFVKGRYARAHLWEFDGGQVVPGSPSPEVVRPPRSDPSAVDPEEALTAALASCHMLTFLYLVSKAGHTLLSYEDAAEAELSKTEAGVPWISRIFLKPRLVFWQKAPSPEELAELHERAHSECYIAQSIRAEVLIETAEVRVDEQLPQA